MSHRTHREAEPVEQRVAVLKERVYITFAALAVVLAMFSHSSELTVGAAATTLSISVVGTLLAVFVADLISHIAVQQHLPRAAEFRQMISVSARALGILLTPLLVLAGAALGFWTLSTALLAVTLVLLGSLVFIAYLAVRRVRLPFWQRALVLGAEAGLGAAVVALELLAHG